MSGIDSMYYVHKHLTERDLLEQLAEECGELEQASLKLIRAKGYSSNITPKSEHEATEQLKEEAIDVCMILRMLGCLPHHSTVENSPRVHTLRCLHKGLSEGRHLLPVYGKIMSKK